MMRCAALGKTQKVKYLVEVNGVDPNTFGKQGETALHLACKYGYTVSLLWHHPIQFIDTFVDTLFDTISGKQMQKLHRFYFVNVFNFFFSSNLIIGIGRVFD